jgi:REP element-mobilizing transposase RayT
LCGTDRATGRRFDHRKEWIEQRLAQLSEMFAIDLLSYAIMSNHYHVTVRLDKNQAMSWSDDEVASRWARNFSVRKPVTPAQIVRWRNRLFDLSWFMGCINEPIARRANKEDGCKGHFWEGRFKCQALLDDPAAIACMVYVDLNPIRASMAQTPESSLHTSIKARIDGRDAHLAKFRGTGASDGFLIPLKFEEYLSLVDWTGRQIRRNKKGRIPDFLPPILDRLDSDRNRWVAEMKNFGNWYCRAVGSLHALEAYCKHLGQQWLKGKVRSLRAERRSTNQA